MVGPTRPEDGRVKFARNTERQMESPPVQELRPASSQLVQALAQSDDVLARRELRCIQHLIVLRLDRTSELGNGGLCLQDSRKVDVRPLSEEDAIPDEGGLVSNEPDVGAIVDQSPEAIVKSQGVLHY